MVEKGSGRTGRDVVMQVLLVGVPAVWAEGSGVIAFAGYADVLIYEQAFLVQFLLLKSPQIGAVVFLRLIGLPGGGLS